jgi:predicted HAD superfamily hydrolase
MTTVSFDIFDTVLRRIVSHPREVFTRVENRLNQPGFAAARITAQRRAHAFGREPTLREIYEPLRRHLKWTEKQTRAAEAMELEEEWRVLSPVLPFAQDALGACRRDGARVCFVSDMYLPSSFLGAALDEHRLREPSETVYVSCEHRRSKRRGTLFPYLKQVIPDLAKHYGDDPHADVAMARRAGLETIYFGSARTTRFEQALEPAYTEVIRSARAARAAATLESWDLGAGLTGPIAHSFLDWLNTAAVADGVDQLLFLARDAQLLHHVYSGSTPANYVYISRFSLNKCLFDPLDPSNRDWLYDVPERTARAVLANCGIDARNLLQTQLGNAVSLDALDQPTSFPKLIRRCESLFREAAINDLITAEQARQRVELRQYLLSSGIEQAKRLGVVDLGWQGTIQKRLAKLLPELGFAQELTGFYIQCTDPTLDAHSFLQLPPAWLTRYRVVIEAMFPACHGQTLGYQQGGPVLAAFPHLTPEPWHAVLEGARRVISELQQQPPISATRIQHALTALAADPDWHSASTLAPIRFNAATTAGDPFLPKSLKERIATGFPWPEGLVRLAIPRTTPIANTAVRLLSTLLRELRFARRWVLHHLFGLRRP